MLAIKTLLVETTALLRRFSGPMAVTEEELSSIHRVREVVPTHYPAIDRLGSVRPGPETARFCEVLQEAAPFLQWRQTYREEDGFDRDYLDAYAWCDIVGPEGPADANGIRVTVGFWGQGLVYPDHAHPPDEYYLVLAGSAGFRLKDQPFQRLGPGGVFHVPSRCIHSADMREEALLALAIWRHEDVSVRIDLTDSGRKVERT